MRIKFKSPDPRAGTVAQMDSRRGQELIDAGSAVRVGEDSKEVVPSETPLTSALTSETMVQPQAKAAVDAVAAAKTTRGKR